MLTRIRVEGTGETESAVKQSINDFFAALLRREDWVEEVPIQIQTTKGGYWGYCILRRKNAS